MKTSTSAVIDPDASDDDYWNQLAENDLASLRPTARWFGWDCAWSAPGLYHVGPYDVSYCTDQDRLEVKWELHHRAPGGFAVDEEFVLAATDLYAIGAGIYADAVRRMKRLGKLH